MPDEIEVTCENCDYRKAVAAAFDIHIDWKCCIMKCEYKKLKKGKTLLKEGADNG